MKDPRRPVFFPSLVLLDRLVRLEVGGEAGETAGLAACAALLLHPSSLFLSAVYAESLFLVLSVGAFLGARSGRFAIAGMLGGLATLTRPFGVLLVVPLVWELWVWRGDADDAATRRARTVSGLWALLVPAAIAGYMLFSRSIFGDPLALLHRQERWRGGLSGPWRAFLRWWEAGPTAHGAHGSTVELVIALVCLAMLVVMIRKLRPSYTLYTAAALILALGSSLWSFSRLALTLFPFFMLIGMAWADGRRCLPTVYAWIGGTLGGFFMALFANADGDVQQSAAFAPIWLLISPTAAQSGRRLALRRAHRTHADGGETQAPKARSNVPSCTPPRPSRCKHHISLHLSDLATKAGEISGLGMRSHVGVVG
jgi:hypothetical protein